MSPSNKWKIVETKKEKHQDQWSGRQYDAHIVYVSFRYKSIVESPVFDSKPVKEVLAGVVFDAKTGYYMRSNRIAKGDVPWDEAQVRKVNAIRTIIAKGTDQLKERIENERMEISNAVEILIDLLRDIKYLTIRSNGALALGKLGDKQAIEPLITVFLKDEEEYLRNNAKVALESLGSNLPSRKVFYEKYVEVLKTNNWDRISALKKDKEWVKKEIRLFKGNENSIKVSAPKAFSDDYKVELSNAEEQQ